MAMGLAKGDGIGLPDLQTAIPPARFNEMHAHALASSREQLMMPPLSAQLCSAQITESRAEASALMARQPRLETRDTPAAACVPRTEPTPRGARGVRLAAAASTPRLILATPSLATPSPSSTCAGRNSRLSSAVTSECTLSGLRSRPPSAAAAPHGHSCHSHGPGRFPSSWAVAPTPSKPPDSPQVAAPRLRICALNRSQVHQVGADTARAAGSRAGREGRASGAGGRPQDGERAVAPGARGG